MTTAQNPPVRCGRRFFSIPAFGLVFVLALALSGVAAAQDPPLAAWRQAVAQAEAGLRAVRADDTAARTDLQRQLGQTRSEIETWLASYPPAQNETWLMPAPASMTRIEDLAVEAGNLRAAIGLITTSMDGRGENGTFYLGVVDVAVSTEPISAFYGPARSGTAVVSASDVRTYDRESLSEAAALVPGVAFVRAGSKNETQITVRGFDIRQVPVFIDGIPVYTPYDGYADLERFTTFDVSELRISKSFSSVLYGPNALGGAINVVSRRPRGQVEGTSGLSYGSGESWNGFVNMGSRFEGGYVQAGGSYLEADTFPLSEDFTPTRYQAAGDRDNAYRRDGKFNAKVGFTPNSTNEYTISYVGQRGKKGNPVYAGSDPAARARFWKWPYYNKDSAYFASNTDLGAPGYLRGRVFYDMYENELDAYDDNTYTTQNRPSSFRSLYNDHTWGASAEWGKTFGTVQTLRAAFHVKKDAHKENNVGSPETRNEGLVTSLGIEDTIAFTPGLSMVLGIGGSLQTTSIAEYLQQGRVVDLARGDTSGIDPQIGVFYSLPDSGRVRATYSHKTRLPTMSNRYSHKFGFAIPNPELKPERSDTFETGYQGTAGARTTYDVTVFYSRITDLIQQFYLSPNLTQNQNIGRASAAGVEAATRIRPASRVDVNFNYAFLRRENLSDPAVLPIDAPRHKGLLSVNVQPVTRVHVMGIVEFEAGRKLNNPSGAYVDAGNITTLGAKAIFTILERLDAELAGMNLTDKNYWLSEGFPESGRTVQFNLRSRF